MNDTFRASAKALLDGVEAHLATLPPDTTFEVTAFRETGVYGVLTVPFMQTKELRAGWDEGEVVP